VSSVPLFIRHARAGGHPAVELMVEWLIIKYLLLSALDSRFRGNDGRGYVWFVQPCP
jgi:hypothetical protein